MFQRFIRTTSFLKKNAQNVIPTDFSKKPVGRWIVNDDVEKAHIRATFANMDSCGDSLCGTPSEFSKVYQHLFSSS